MVQDFLPPGIMASRYPQNASSLDRQGSPFDSFSSSGSNVVPGDYFSDIIPPPTFQFPGPSVAMPTTSVQATPRTKTRAFPRTNPAYVGSRQRDGVRPAYRKVNGDQSQMASGAAGFGHRFQDGRMSDTVQNPPFPLELAADRRRGFRHERSDSDTSHSSFGIGRLQQADMTGFPIQRSNCSRDPFSDSHGSLSGLMSAESLSSQGSGRGGFADGSVGAGTFASSPYDSLSSSHESPCHRLPTDAYGSDPYRHQLALHLAEKNHTQSAHGTPTARTRVRRNSEPDYANLPVVQQLLGQLDVVTDPPFKDREKPFGHGGGPASVMMVANDQHHRSRDSERSVDSLSPVEFLRQQQNTPSSVHSASTHESTSEGIVESALCVYRDSNLPNSFSTAVTRECVRLKAGADLLKFISV
jgi:hypothetical protein